MAAHYYVVLRPVRSSSQQMGPARIWVISSAAIEDIFAHVASPGIL
jgi:hypothetical protein